MYPYSYPEVPQIPKSYNAFYSNSYDTCVERNKMHFCTPIIVSRLRFVNFFVKVSQVCMPSTIFARFDSLSALIIDIRNAYESSHSIFIQRLCYDVENCVRTIWPHQNQSAAWWPQASFRQAIALNQGYFYQARLYLSSEFESIIRKTQNICAKVSTLIFYQIEP